MLSLTINNYNIFQIVCLILSAKNGIGNLQRTKRDTNQLMLGDEYFGINLNEDQGL